MAAQIFPPKQAPYGSWESPIKADLIAKGAIKPGYIEEVGGSIYYSELRPQERGRTALVRMGEKGQQEELLPSDYNARTRVHEYGGKSFLVVGDTIFFSNDADQQLYKRNGKGIISRLTSAPKSRFADGCYDATRNLLYCVMEVQGESVENCLITVDPENGSIRRVAEGADFYLCPRVSPDGKSIAYLSWNHPNMPWDGCELHLAPLKPDGTFGKTRVVAGGLEESIVQPSWGLEGQLYFVSDRTGWWNLYCENKGKIDPLFPQEAEFGFPYWVTGQTCYGLWNGGVVAIRSSKGIDELVFIKDHQAEPLLPGIFSTIKNLTVAGDQVYFVGGSETTAPSFIQYNMRQRTSKILRMSREEKISSDSLSVPQAIEFPTEKGRTAHAFYYAPKNSRFQAPSGEFPPLLVLSHGGPTGQTSSQLNLEVQYWTSRGVAVVDVNYGGSTGYGRAYRDRLKGNWGVVDVDDCTNAALYCVKKHYADPKRLAIEGGSAGGYTTLACLAFRSIFKAGASYFGVSDLVALNEHTHKFEAHYNDQLVGPYPAQKDLYIARSPIYHVDQIKSPVILLQGAEDAIVPPPQSEKMYESLKKRGIPTAYLLFEKEQHGFRQAANIQRALEATAYFFSKIFGFRLADPIQPIKMENLDEK